MGADGRSSPKWSDPPTEGVEPKTSEKFACRAPGALVVNAGASGDAPPVPRSQARPEQLPPGSPTGIVLHTHAGTHRTADRMKAAVPDEDSRTGWRGHSPHSPSALRAATPVGPGSSLAGRESTTTNQPTNAVIVPPRHFCAHSSWRRPVAREHTRSGNGARFIRAAPGARPRAGLPRSRCPPP